MLVSMPFSIVNVNHGTGCDQVVMNHLTLHTVS
jgi:hypothetical protein